MLLDGEIDAAVVGDKLPDPRLKHLIPDHEAAAQRWAQKHGGVPINHMVVVQNRAVEIAARRRAEVFRLLRDSKNAAGAPEEPRAASVWCRGVPPGAGSHDRLLPPAGAYPGAAER